MVFEAIKQKILPKDSIKRGLQLKFWGISILILGHVEELEEREEVKEKKRIKIVPAVRKEGSIHSRLLQAETKPK